MGQLVSWTQWKTKQRPCFKQWQVRASMWGCPLISLCAPPTLTCTWRRKDSFDICMSIKSVFLPDSHWLHSAIASLLILRCHHLSWFDAQFVSGVTRLARSSSSQIHFSFLTGKWSWNCHTLKDGTSRLWNITSIKNKLAIKPCKDMKGSCMCINKYKKPIWKGYVSVIPAECCCRNETCGHGINLNVHRSQGGKEGGTIWSTKDFYGDANILCGTIMVNTSL